MRRYSSPRSRVKLESLSKAAPVLALCAQTEAYTATTR